MPPIAGLHDICAIRSTFSVNNAVLSPMRAAAIAASQPAWPAPTTTTSNCSVNCCMKLGESANAQIQCGLILHSNKLATSVIFTGNSPSLADLWVGPYSNGSYGIE